LTFKKSEITFTLFFIFTIVFNEAFTMNTGVEKKTSDHLQIYKSAKPFVKLNSKKVIDIYYIPHPDDETLSMGVAIADSVYKGHEVHLILLSQGFDSEARGIINGKDFCKWHKRYHYPKREGYNPLPYYKFGRLRRQEFMNASVDLGVVKKNIEICNFQNGNFNESDMKNIVLKYEEIYPYSYHNTTSIYDYNNTHKTTAKVLLELYRSAKIKHVKFYISPDKYRAVKGSVVSNSHINNLFRKSISDYSTWNPTQSSYAIGYHSVGILFRIARKKMISKYYTTET
jgi:LmbE family N-acetylglucosaminyl deacetylase